MTCPTCGVDYPASLLQMQHCGICALARRNERTGRDDKAFAAGTVAESLRQGAERYRQQQGETQ